MSATVSIIEMVTRTESRPRRVSPLEARASTIANNARRTLRGWGER
jgi:hypothetical protein